MALIPRPQPLHPDDAAPPTNILGGVADFWQYIRTDRPHRWTSLTLALTITGLVLWGMYQSLLDTGGPDRQIIYVKNWRADRSQLEIERDWLKRARQANIDNAIRRGKYQQLGRAIGTEFDPAKADQETRDALADIDRAEQLLNQGISLREQAAMKEKAKQAAQQRTTAATPEPAATAKP